MQAPVTGLDIVIVVMVLAGVGLYLYARGSRRALLAARLKTELQRTGRQDAPENRKWLSDHQWRGGVARILRRIGAAVPLSSSAQRTEVAQKLVAAGFRNPQSLMV